MQGLLNNSRILNSSIFGAGGSNIKSIQRGLSSIAADGTSQSIAVSSVDPSTSILLIDIYPNSNNSQIAQFFVRAKLNSATSILAYRGESHTVTAEFTWQLIEFEPKFVKSVQRGTVLDPVSGELSIAISAVNTGKAMAFANFSTLFANSTSFSQMGFGVELRNSTTLVIPRHGDYNRNRTFEWQVIEFK